MKKILFLSFLADHPEGDKYTNGIPWKEFRTQSNQRFSSLDRLFKEQTKWEIKNVETLNSLEWKNIDFDEYSLIVLGGSPYSVEDSEKWIENTLEFFPSLIEKLIPIVGICFGHQLLAKILGGKVSKAKKYYQGDVAVECLEKNDIYISYANHGEYVSVLPKNAKTLAKGPDDMPYVVEYLPHVLGVQCHMERTVACEFSENYWRELLGRL